MKNLHKKRKALAKEEHGDLKIRVSSLMRKITITIFILGCFSAALKANPLPSIIQLLLDEVVVDHPPVITCPIDQTISSSISVNYSGPNATATDDNDPNPTIDQSPTVLPSGTTTTITATATDNLNQSSQCTFNVTVSNDLVCQPGFQPSTSVANTCEACPAGTVSPGGTTACETCIASQPNSNQSACEPSPSGTYEGCFMWTIGINDLQTITQPGMTPSNCVSHCTEFGFAYGAIREQNICGCGNNAPQIGTCGSVCQCQPCMASLSQECGGVNAISVYSTGEAPVVSGFGANTNWAQTKIFLGL